MAEEPHSLILERLRELREEQRQIHADIREVKEGQTSIRHMLVAMQSDDLRQEAMLAAPARKGAMFENRPAIAGCADVDIIKRRLNLVEA
jgi:DNA-binding protein H-NS